MGVAHTSQPETGCVQRIAQVRERAERDMVKRIPFRLAERPAVAMIEAAAEKPHARPHPHDIRRGQDQRPLRLQHAVQLAQVRESILEVLDALDRQRGVEHRVGKGEPAVEVDVVIRGAEAADAAGVDVDGRVINISVIAGCDTALVGKHGCAAADIDPVPLRGVLR